VLNLNPDVGLTAPRGPIGYNIRAPIRSLWRDVRVAVSSRVSERQRVLEPYGPSSPRSCEFLEEPELLLLEDEGSGDTR